MKLGFSLLNNWGIEDVHVLVDLAVRAEALGLHSVWVHDHIVIPEQIEAREVDRIRVVGKSEPVRVFELLGRKGELDAATLELKGRFEEGLAHYRNGELDPAEASFKACLGIKQDDGPSKVFLARLQHFRDHPEARRADGVWDLTKK